MQWISLSLILLFTACSIATAEDTKFPPPGDESEKYQTEVVLDGLQNPCGLVGRPPSNAGESPRVHFIESGTGRVLEFLDTEVGKTREVLTGLSVGAPSEELGLEMSGWRLGFVTPTKLAVLGGTQRNGAEQLAVFVLPEDGKALNVEQIDHAVAIGSGNEAGTLSFPGMVVGETTVFVTSGSETGGGTVSGATLAANRIEEPRTLLFIKPEDKLRWPSGSCLSPSGRTQFLVTGYLGQLSGELDGRITFVVPSSGEVVLELACGLRDIVDVAYSPSGQLYVIDLAWQDEKAGGVYRLDDARFEGRPACRAVKIAEVTKPTSLLFDAIDTLYVTSLGMSENAKQGSVIRITGEF